MQARSIEAIVTALNRAGVRYLVVGGVAVAAHGFLRFTADIDIVLDPDTEAMRRAVGALSGLGYRPRAPVDFVDLADPRMRRAWVAEKGLTVFSLFSREHPATEVDLFVEVPFDFERAYADAARFEVAPGVTATFVGRSDLIEMKRRSGRPEDLADLEGLQASWEPDEDSDG